jgi:hypothetical protein
VAPGAPNTSYDDINNLVVDAEPRMISNLIVDQTVENPAAMEMMSTVEGSYTFDHDNDPATPDRIFIPNVSPDVGLSAPFTGWFTLFGQFFDHGLDLVGKGGSGSIMVPLQPDDELYVEGSNTNFMMLSRATNLPGPDGIPGNGDDVQDAINRTTPFIDQNQTYTSQASHQAFIREYDVVGGRPVNTGKLMNGDDVDNDGIRDGLATWADIKEQAATVLGIALDDMDVNEVPLLKTDPYGHFIPGPNGFPQLVISDTQTIEGNPAAPVDATQAMGAGVAFLDDIAHDAVPNTDNTHNEELLAKHFITGDGRGNENIGLTAVHHVFHSEHNRLVDHIDELLTDIGATDPDFVARWHDQDQGWDYGERLFQAARFVTEMQYQHLVFEEFVRTISPNIDAGPLNESLYHADINPAISAEFAHVVYRFGHSMLTDEIDRAGFGADSPSMSLFDAFLNPDAFTNNGAMTPDQGAAAVLMGMSKQTGNGIDEFVDSTLRNQLLGPPLRPRHLQHRPGPGHRLPDAADDAPGVLRPDAGRGPEALRQLGGVPARPEEPGLRGQLRRGLQHPPDRPEPRPPSRASAPRRRLSWLDPAFMSTPAANSGLNDVDFWVGGLAERGMDFGGMLGSTFNAVFETEMEDLQNADRFYYLTRTAGMNLIQQLEGNSFSELALRNTDATGLNHNIFANPDPHLRGRRARPRGSDGDPATPDLGVINGWHPVRR